MTHPVGQLPPPRILHVIDRLWGGGAEASLVAHLRAVVRADADNTGVVCLCGDERSVAIAATLGLRAWMGAPTARRFGLKDVRLLRRAVTDFAPDVLHTSLARSATAGGLATRSIPHLVTATYPLLGPLHLQRKLGWSRDFVQFAFRWLHAWAITRPNTHLHAVSRATRATLVDRHPGMRAQTTVIHRGRPPAERLSPDEIGAIRSDLGIDSEELFMLCVAREVPAKGHETLLRSATLLREAGVGFRLLLAGRTGPASDDIARLIVELGLSDHVLRLGHRSDVARLIGAADVIVSSSLAEGTPGALLEAMSAGRPVIALPAPGVDEALGTEHPGLLATRNEAMLADAVARFAKDPSFRQRLAAAGVDRYQAAFTLDRYVAEMNALYARLASDS